MAVMSQDCIENFGGVGGHYDLVELGGPLDLFQNPDNKGQVSQHDKWLAGQSFCRKPCWDDADGLHETTRLIRAGEGVVKLKSPEITVESRSFPRFGEGR